MTAQQRRRARASAYAAAIVAVHRRGAWPSAISISARNASQPRHSPGRNGADWDAEDRGDFPVAHAFEADEQNHLTLVVCTRSR